MRRWMKRQASEPDLQALMEAARAARKGAYARYSHFAVGAALLWKDGEIVSGANVENASYGLTMCAERVALYAALARGKPGRELVALCVVGAPERTRKPEPLTTPCGACRQVLYECNPTMLVGCAGPDGLHRFRLDELLPHAFDPDALPRP
jgi:cytidine deaminase